VDEQRNRPPIAQHLARGGGLYPDILCTRLGENAPATLTAIGSLAHLGRRKTALFCSARTPGHTIIAAYDQAARWHDERRRVISGFHSPVERVPQHPPAWPATRHRLVDL
jgi:hypothetical protein